MRAPRFRSALNMAADRLLRILTKLSARGAEGTDIERVCTVAVDVTAATGAAVMLLTGDLPQVSFHTADSLSRRIEDLQFMLGEGPSLDVHRRGGVILEPDVAASDLSRWPVFAHPALEAGLRAMFCFPVRVGAARLGALSLYRDAPGTLDDEQYADALVLADVAARTLLLLQSEAPPGTLAVELEAEGDFHLVVHQAAGMVSMQLGINITDALLRIRAHAFGNGVLVADVARDVVDRRLRFGRPSD
jgi:hypothetical protein